MQSGDQKTYSSKQVEETPEDNRNELFVRPTIKEIGNIEDDTKATGTNCECPCNS